MVKIIFFGTPAFAAHILEYLISQNVPIAAVVTKPDKPQGRSSELKPPAVKVSALNAGIAVLQPLKASTPEFAEILKSYDADLFVVVAYSEIFKEILLKLPPLGCVNVHASLLPKYRGAAPIHRAVMNGDKESGVTIMSMAKELDAGEILSVAKTPIPEDMTTGELFQKLSELGAKELYKVLCQFDEDSVVRTAQDPKLVTYAPKVTPEEAFIDWSRSAEDLHNHIRGLTPKPGAWCFVTLKGDKKRFIVKKTKVVPNILEKPGTLIPSKGLTISCAQGALDILEVQLEGKKPMKIEEFLRGILKEELVIS